MSEMSVSEFVGWYARHQLEPLWGFWLAFRWIMAALTKQPVSDFEFKSEEDRYTTVKNAFMMWGRSGNNKRKVGKNSIS